MADSGNTDSSDSSDSNGHETCFLDLSAELRNEIYELALFPTEEDEQAKQPATACRLNFTDATKPMVPEPGLLRSCRQARIDASPMFYSRTTFEIPLIHLTRFIKSTKPENLAAIRDLRIHDYVSQCTKNMVGVCKAIVAIKSSPLSMEAIKVCTTRPYTQARYASGHSDRRYSGRAWFTCQWKSLVELEDYYLHTNELKNKVKRAEDVRNRYWVQAIAPKQLEAVIERVTMTPTKHDELTESLLYVARHYKYLKGWKSRARVVEDDESDDDDEEDGFGLL